MPINNGMKIYKNNWKIQKSWPSNVRNAPINGQKNKAV